jgi:hypothetical protein
MPFIPTIFWCYNNFDLNLLSMATEDKSTDISKMRDLTRLAAAFQNCLINGPKKKERRRKQVKKIIFKMCYGLISFYF